MSRPQKCRRVCAEPRFTRFAPAGVRDTQVICLSTDEYEVLRLVDYERKTHEECSRQMDISRTTVTEIYDSARRKLADFLVNGYRLEISGGNYRICGGEADCCCDRRCHRDEEKAALNFSEAAKIKKSGGSALRIALCYESGRVFPHFGHTEHFQICDVGDGRILLKTIVNTVCGGRGSLPAMLSQLGVDKLICGGIGSGAVKLLEKAGIEVISGVSGDADDALEAYLKGSLHSDGSAVCIGREK